MGKDMRWNMGESKGRMVCDGQGAKDRTREGQVGRDKARERRVRGCLLYTSPSPRDS